MTVFRPAPPAPRNVPECALCHKPVDAFIRDHRFASCSYTAICHGEAETVEIPEVMARVMSGDPGTSVTLGLAFAGRMIEGARE